MYYYWEANSSDGAYYDESKEYFGTKEDAYNDMRNAALKKMKWNTQYDEDFDDENMVIEYKVLFRKNKIIHESYSGTYTYVLKEKEET